MAPSPDVMPISLLMSSKLGHAGREYDAFTPVTMELPKKSGIEPDCASASITGRRCLAKERESTGV